jgi:GTP cyclohydrolase II
MESLPNDIILDILQYLNIRDVSKMSVNKRFEGIVNDQRTWRRIASNLFPSDHYAENTNYKDFVKDRMGNLIYYDF